MIILSINFYVFDRLTSNRGLPIFKHGMEKKRGREGEDAEREIC